VDLLRETLSMYDYTMRNPWVAVASGQANIAPLSCIALASCLYSLWRDSAYYVYLCIGVQNAVSDGQDGISFKPVAGAIFMLKTHSTCQYHTDLYPAI
jgi:hypothetical protein